MNKFLLILLLLVTSSCELPSIIQADQYIEPIPLEASKDIPLYENVWDRIKDTNSREQANPDEKTLGYINAYLANPSQLNKLLEKGRYFIFFVLEELDRYRLPSELALLPYIESNYDPFSISASGAMGIWQFMPATARIYGLEDTWWYEQRHDPLVSSKAAVILFTEKGMKYYFLLVILGGSLGNLFDRMYFGAVPDFIDLNYNGYHWFIFNVADIFITIGIILLILAEFISYKKVNE